MDPIKPTKVIKPVVNPDLPVSEHIDSAVARSAYDPRISYADQSLVESFKHYPLMRFFGLSEDEKADDKINEKIKSIYNFSVHKAQSNDPNKFMRAIRFLEMEIGTPPLGTTRLDHISGLIEIENNMHDLENERRFKYGL